VGLGFLCSACCIVPCVAVWMFFWTVWSVLLSVLGVFVTLSGIFSFHPGVFTMWLLLLQVLISVENCCPQVLACAFTRAVAQFTEESCLADWRITPGRLWKIIWCVIAKCLAFGNLFVWAPWFLNQYANVLLVWLISTGPGGALGLYLLTKAACRGELGTARGARPETRNMLETVPYNPSLFADPRSMDDPRPLNECCFCREEYTELVPIVKTPCQHLMHRDCLERWLRTSRHCPMCRADIEVRSGP